LHSLYRIHDLLGLLHGQRVSMCHHLLLVLCSMLQDVLQVSNNKIMLRKLYRNERSLCIKDVVLGHSSITDL